MRPAMCPFESCGEVLSRKKRGESVAARFQGLPASLEAIDQRERVAHLETFRLGALDGLESGCAGGDHVLENRHLPTRLQRLAPFDPLAGAVALGLFSDHEGGHRMAGEKAGQADR